MEQNSISMSISNGLILCPGKRTSHVANVIGKGSSHVVLGKWSVICKRRKESIDKIKLFGRLFFCFWLK